MAREWVSRRPAVRLLEAVQEKPQRGKVLVHLPDLLFAPAAYEWETAYFHSRVSALCGHFDAKGIRKTCELR